MSRIIFILFSNIGSNGKGVSSFNHGGAKRERFNSDPNDNKFVNKYCEEEVQIDAKQVSYSLISKPISNNKQIINR
jgi:hypothetical protein